MASSKAVIASEARQSVVALLQKLPRRYAPCNKVISLMTPSKAVIASEARQSVVALLQKLARR